MAFFQRVMVLLSDFKLLQMLFFPKENGPIFFIVCPGKF